jgi:hypothetical protein
MCLRFAVSQHRLLRNCGHVSHIGQRGQSEASLDVGELPNYVLKRDIRT